ncbi:MAG: ATP-binding protein [Leptolyngbyaceae bacterium]|nr:ATP-binding protein [Leptolyngbyaceae bacterium]
MSLGPARRWRKGGAGTVWRWWTQSMTGRMVLLFALGLLFAQSLTGVLYWRDRQLHTPATFMETVSDRVVAIATLLDTLPPNQYPVVLQALNDPLLRVEPWTSPAPPVPREGQRRNTHSPSSWSLPSRLPSRQRRIAQLQEHLSQALTDPVTVTVRSAHPPHPSSPKPPAPILQPGMPPPLWPSDRQLVIIIDKTRDTSADSGSPGWLLTLPIGFGSRYSGPPFPLWLGLTGLGIWALAAWGTQRITAPLLQFAAAADRLGRDVNAPPLPERGSWELRQVAQAFNQMQERLQRLIGDRTLMLAALSHDLRTVLTRLRLRSEFIHDPIQQEKAQADLGQMEWMLNATLSFAKEDSTPEPRTSLDLASLLQSICDDLSDAGYPVDYRGINAPASPAPASPVQRLIIEGQPTALRRAFTNMIENGAIYGKSATVSLMPLSTGVEVAIADQGPGIPPDKQEEVFKPFVRLEQSRNRATGGTGLGLAVARTVIRRHGGDIRLQNDPDAGSLGQRPPERTTTQPGEGFRVIVTLPTAVASSQF